MELKLKDEDKIEGISEEDLAKNKILDFEKDFSEPRDLPPIKTDSTYTGSFKKEKSIGGLVIKLLIIGGLIAAAVFLVMKIFFPKVKDISNCVNMDSAALEKELGVKLERNDKTAGRVRQYSSGNVTTDGNGDIAVLYLDGKQFGIHIDNKKYSIYGIKIGDTLIDVRNNITYKYENTFNVMNDLYSGKSTSDFYFSRATNDCLMLTYNDTSGRVVAITYFNDFRRATEKLSGLPE